MKQIQTVVRDIQPHWVGDGFPVRSLFSYHEGNECDPFLLLDYGGPYEFSPTNSRRGVEVHPHRGFETVTIVYQGELAHRDSSGSQGSMGPGDVQWMTAASGIVHEEFHSEAFSKTGGTLEMIQLWVNLPAKDKMCEPHYQGIVDGQIPRVELADNAGVVRVIAGEYSGTRGAAKTFTPINVWDLQLNSHQNFDLQIPAGHTSMLFVQTGAATVAGKKVNPGEMALFERTADSSSIRLDADFQADAASRLLVLSGEPLNEPVAGRGPFVMNTQAEIKQAIRDYQNGRMGQLS